MHASEVKRLPLVVSKHVRALETMHDEHVNEKKSTRKVWVKKKMCILVKLINLL